MAEYYAVLSKAVAGLTESADARRKVYDKARNALIGQLKAIDPPLAAQEISRQRLELEEAIRRVERETAAAAMTAAPRAPRRESVAPQPQQPSPEDMFRRAVEDAGASERAAATEPRRPSQEWAATPHAQPQQPGPGYGQPQPAHRPPPPNDPYQQPGPAAYAPHQPDPVYAPQHRPQPTQPQPAQHHPQQPGYGAEPPVEPQQPRQPEYVPPSAAAPVEAPTIDWSDEGRDEPPRGYRQAEPQAYAPSRDGDYWDSPSAPEERREPSWTNDGGRSAAPTAVIPDPFDDDDGDDDDAPPRRRRGRSDDRDLLDEPVRRSRWPAVLLSALLILLIGGLGALAWLQRDRIEDLIALFDSQVEQPTPEITAPREGGLSEPAKLADRLLSGGDGSGVREVGSSGGLAALPLADSGPGAVTTGATPPASPSPAPAGIQASALVAQAATLYEEPLNAETPGEGIVAIPAEVAWRFEPASGATGDQVTADIRVPDRGMDIGLTIWENDDDTLPASHLVEVIVRSSNVTIEQVPRLVLKTAEGGRGQPLIGASAKVADGIFWIALSNNPNDVNFNTDLLRRQGWIDLPLVYGGGQRAIITVEKGEPGRQALSQALAAWNGN